MAAAAPDGMQKLEEFSSGLEKGQAVNVWWGGDGCCYEGKVVSSLKLKDGGAGQVIFYEADNGTWRCCSRTRTASGHRACPKLQNALQLSTANPHF